MNRSNDRTPIAEALTEKRLKQALRDYRPHLGCHDNPCPMCETIGTALKYTLDSKEALFKCRLFVQDANSIVTIQEN